MTVFLSHNSADKPAVESLARRLEADGFSCWLDKWNLVPGNAWDEALEVAVNTCDVCLIFFGISGVGPWQNEEMRLAIRKRVSCRERNLRIVPVILPGGHRTVETQLPSFLQGISWVEFQQSLDEPDAYHRLKCGILGQPPGYGIGDVTYNGQCPYVGLKAFRREDNVLYFGRDAILQQILARQQLHFGSIDERRFIALIGASGSGKSSLVAAGLLPAILERGALPDSQNWLCVQCRPGSHPWDSLQVALASHVQLARHFSVVSELIKSPEDECRRLHLLASIALHGRPETHRLIVFVDQFEEFFTSYNSAKDPDGHLMASRQNFLENLLYPSTVPDSRVIVVITMRADFFGHCSTLPGLRAAVSENQILIGTMARAEIREAIQRPAQLCGCEVEPLLVEQLLNDMERQPGALPFLQHALFRLWEARNGRRLTAKAYMDMGRLEGALDAHCEAFYARTAAGQKDHLRSVMLELVQLGDGAADTKRRRPLSQLSYGKTNNLHHFIAELADAHIVVTDLVGEDVQVELSHEALITGWSRLKAWIDETRDEKRLLDRIEAAAREWQAATESIRSDFLWHGAQLESAEFALKESTISLNDLSKDFLEACREQRALDARKREAIAQRELENNRRVQEAENAKLLAEARAEKERAQEVERKQQAMTATAKELVAKAEALWAEFRESGNIRPQDWQLMRLSEIETTLVDALAHDRDTISASEMLVGVRRVLVETGINTYDLNLASIYLEKLRTMESDEFTNIPLLARELSTARQKTDPVLNTYTRSLRKWAIVGCWLPTLWSALVIAAAWGLGGFNSASFFLWLVTTSGFLAILHMLAALFAVMVSTGDQRGVEKINAASVSLVIVGLAGLNLVTIVIAAIMILLVSKIRMEKLLWLKPSI